MTTKPVCVVIPAYNAEATIGVAITSALLQPMVGEVIVVDDASTDGTQSAIAAADDGSKRLRVLRQPHNAGPSAARNAALAESGSPLIALLDADDYFLPHRFEPLLMHDRWDLIADNIAFVPEGSAHPVVPDTESARSRPLHLAEFVERNISQRGKARGELGFLKPLMRRTVLDRLRLRYDENIRLGEDFLLYAAAIARQARFVLVERCGYVAMERANSLSGKHRTADLAALMDASRALASDPAILLADRRVLQRHADSIRAKVEHRLFLEDKAQHGLMGAVLPRISRPYVLGGVARDILRDKRDGYRPVPAPRQRLLFAPAEFER